MDTNTDYYYYRIYLEKGEDGEWNKIDKNRKYGRRRQKEKAKNNILHC